MKKILAVFIVLLLFIILGISYLWFHRVTKKVFLPRALTVASPNEPQTIAEYLKTQTPLNILLLGYGGGNHDGAYLTDSMLLVRIDPKQQKIYLLSVPRDLWVKIPTKGDEGNYWKINAAYTLGLDNTSYPDKKPEFKGPDGGGRLAEYMVELITGQPIRYFIGADFSGFTHTIDTLGGVDINVNPAFTDPKYPITGKEEDPCSHTPEEIKTFTATASAETDLQNYFSCRYTSLHFDAGQTHMDGATALSYVRSRHSLEDGTDFGRARRQRNLLLAVKQKIFSTDFLPKLIPFVNSLGDDLRTDLTPADAQALLADAVELNRYEDITLALTDQNFLNDAVSDDGQDILVPKTGTDDWADIRRWTADSFSGKPQPVPAKVQVVNGTAVPGLASSVTNKLTNSGLQTLAPGNVNGSTIDRTSLVIYGNNLIPSDLTVLLKQFPLTNPVYQPATTSAYNILITLGNDYQAGTPSPTP